MGGCRMPDRGSAPAGPSQRDEALTTRERRLLWVVTVLWAAGLLYLGLAARLPLLGDVDSSEFSQWGHAFGTMVFAALVYLLLIARGGRTRRQTAVLTFALAVAGGALLELLQAVGGERDPTLVDVAVDAAGALVAVLVLSSARVAPRTWGRIVAAGTAVLLVIAVPAVIFGTPDAPSDACGLARVSPDDRGSAQSPTALPAPIAAYTLDEGSGRTAADSGEPPPLALDLVGRRTTWVDGGGLHFAGGAARSASAATGIVRAVRASDEVTILARFRPERLDETGPARVVTISSGTAEGQVNVHLGQEGRSLSVRLRATCGEFNWTTVPNVFTSTHDTVDVAMTFGDRTERVYVGGAPVAAWRVRGTLRNWDPTFPLVVGNEATLDRPFVGDVYGVRVYGQALDASAIDDLTTK